MNTTSIRRAFAVVCLSLAAIGCGSSARVIDADKEGIVRPDRIDVQDFESASAKMIESLYNSGALERAARKPAVVAFSRIVNDTGEYFDTDLLTVRVIEQLQNGGKVVLSTTLGANPRDQMASEVDQRKRFLNDESPVNNAAVPDFTLIGKIIKNSARAGDVRQATYTFQLMLTDTSRGVTAWIAQRQITKQGTKPAVGL